MPVAQGEAKLYQNQLQLFIGLDLSLYSKHESVQTSFQGLEMATDLLGLSLLQKIPLLHTSHVHPQQYNHARY